MKGVNQLLIASLLAGLWLAAVPSAPAGVGVLAICEEKGGCRLAPMASWTAGNQNKIRLAEADAAKNTALLRRTRVVRTEAVAKLYRNPENGEVRTQPQAELALPIKWKEQVAVATAWDGVSVEFKETLKGKSATTIPIGSFVAIVTGPTVEDAALELIRDLTNEVFTHPRKKELISAALKIAGRSQRLAEWRGELVKRMSSSLSDYRAEKGDPRQLEQRLQSGLEAMEMFRLIAADGNQEEELQKQLVSEFRELKRGIAAATALRKAGFHDAYLAKIDKIGLARWTKADLAGGAVAALKESAAAHHAKALELEKSGLLDVAFDEARIASERMPCDRVMVDHFYSLRVEYVNKNMVPMTTQPERRSRTILEQIVRELDGIGDDRSIDQVRIDYFRGRINEGLRIDKTYLPLQLKRADFLSRIGDLAASQQVVEQVEREEQLTKQDSDSWLRMDASLAERQETTRMRSEKEAKEFFDSGKFAEALSAAERGLKADPQNPKLLSFAARAASVLRDENKAQKFAATYLKSANLACAPPDEGIDTMISLFDRKPPVQASSVGESHFPHWISGKQYKLEDVYYDPISAGFFQQVRAVSSVKLGSSVLFHWDGFTVTSIASTQSVVQGKSASQSTLFELEPKYRRELVYMSEIGMKANSSGDRAAYPLLYLNSPDFDPSLAEKYAKRKFTRGWAGNPFFHPFLWTGIFLFDLSYDTQGRIEEARPAYPDTSRPRSPFSEVLKFKWEGNTNRLLSITGPRYSRVMKYDSLGRLVGEQITFERGKGLIEYKYAGKSRKIRAAKLNDNFFDKTERTVSFRDFTE